MKRNKNVSKSSKWNRIVILGTLVMLLCVTFLTIVVDPFFHYHKPLSIMKYFLNDERHQNDGISRHFNYSAIITGTSMTENFKTTDFEKIYHMKSIKVPFSGAGYKEINDNLIRAFESNNNIEIVVRCLDYSLLIKDKVYVGFFYTGIFDRFKFQKFEGNLF